jgi:hypothetical protein
MDACAASEQLPAALSAEIWIAEGTYRPSESRDKTAYFKVRGNTGYYGGFAGSETAKDERVPGHPVVITGDLGGGVYAEHLFMNTNFGYRNAAFGEMKFTKARALTGTDKYGPAIYVQLAYNITVSNADFENLQAGGGGGAVYASAGSVTITDCDFTYTEAGTQGGAVYASNYNGSVTITDCDFTYTEAGTQGGAVYASGKTIAISGYTSNNTKALHSGGSLFIWLSPGGRASVRNAVITNSEQLNVTGIGTNGGGGIYITAYTSTSPETAEFSSVTFENVQGTTGGAVSFSEYVQLAITNCLIKNAAASEWGGAIYGIGETSCELRDVSFTGCTAPLGNILASVGAHYPGSVVVYPVFIVRPDCKVNGTEIIAANWASVLSTLSGNIWNLPAGTLDFLP